MAPLREVVHCLTAITAPMIPPTCVYRKVSMSCHPVGLEQRLLPGVLIAEAALGFSGAGERINPASYRLGTLIGSGEIFRFDAPWLVFFPGMMLWILAAVLVSFSWAVRRTLGEPIDDRIF